MKTITISWKDIKADFHAYCYGMEDRLVEALKKRIAASLERQMEILLINAAGDPIWTGTVGPDISHDGPTIDLNSEEFFRCVNPLAKVTFVTAS